MTRPEVSLYTLRQVQLFMMVRWPKPCLRVVGVLCLLPLLPKMHHDLHHLRLPLKFPMPRHYTLKIHREHCLLELGVPDVLVTPVVLARGHGL